MLGSLTPGRSRHNVCTCVFTFSWGVGKNKNKYIMCLKTEKKFTEYECHEGVLCTWTIIIPIVPGQLLFQEPKRF